MPHVVSFRHPYTLICRFTRWHENGDGNLVSWAKYIVAHLRLYELGGFCNAGHDVVLLSLDPVYQVEGLNIVDVGKTDIDQIEKLW